jgi:hypothetical protein
MATKMHKKRIKTELGDYFEFGLCFNLPGETDPHAGLGESLLFCASWAFLRPF